LSPLLVRPDLDLSPTEVKSATKPFATPIPNNAKMLVLPTSSALTREDQMMLSPKVKIAKPTEVARPARPMPLVALLMDQPNLTRTPVIYPLVFAPPFSIVTPTLADLMAVIPKPLETPEIIVKVMETVYLVRPLTKVQPLVLPMDLLEPVLNY